MGPSLWHFRAISWKAAYGPQVIESVCPKREERAELHKMEFWKGIGGYEAYILQIRHQLTKLKNMQHIQTVIQHYSSRNIGTTQLENAK
jgi:hypothetical protein